MIFLICFLTILSLGRCLDQVPTRLEIETSINRTIDEVERLIKEEPSLPRLSRGQIVDILHNITSTDIDSYEESVEKARSDYKKALMVVLPYNSKDSQGEDLKDLYTKPPMVQIIPNSEIMLPYASIQEEPHYPNSASDESAVNNLISKKYSDEIKNQYESSYDDYENDQDIYSDIQSEIPAKQYEFNLENINSSKSKSVTVKPKINIVYSTSIKDESTTKATNKIQTTRRPLDEGFRPTMPTTKSTNILSSDQWTYYAPPVTSTTTSTTTPKIFTTTTRRSLIPSSTISTTTTRSTRRRPVTTTRYFTAPSTTMSTSTIRNPTTSSTTPSTTTIKHFTTSSTTTTRRPITTSTIKSTTPRHFTTTTREPFTTTFQPSRKPSQIRNKPAPFLPTVISKTLNEEVYPPFKKLPVTTRKSVEFDMSSMEVETNNPIYIPPTKNYQNNLSPLFKKLSPTTSIPEIVTFDMSKIAIIEEKPTASIYVTPMATAPTTKNTPQTTSEVPKINQAKKKEIENLLATIGLRPTKETNTFESSTLSNEVYNKKDLLIQESNNIIPGYSANLAEVDSPSIITQNKFNNIPNNMRNSVNNFTPDIQLLFQKFGLQIPTGYSDKSSSTTSTTTTVKPTTQRSIPTKNSWNMFKPLPTSEVKDESMKDFLAKFGLGIVETRQEKALKKNNKLTSNYIPSVIDAVPNNMRDILENIGLIIRPRVAPKPRMQTTTTTTTTTEDPEKLHVFKPHESLLDNKNQRDKINELLDTVKMVQEGKADVSDVRKVANDLLKNTKTLSAGPDLLALEEILKNYNEEIKNEVKRQESQTLVDPMDTASSDSEVNIVSAPVSKDSDKLNSTNKNMLDILNSPMDSGDSAGISSDSDAKVVTSGLESSTLSTISTPTEGPNIDDLADSFGGSTAEPDPVLPTPRKSGLYFLVDWNSFLEVGEEGKDQVNLRFAPKVGDKTRFVPVSVP